MKNEIHCNSNSQLIKCKQYWLLVLMLCWRSVTAFSFNTNAAETVAGKSTLFCPVSAYLAPCMSRSPLCVLTFKMAACRQCCAVSWWVRLFIASGIRLLLMRFTIHRSWHDPRAFKSSGGLFWSCVCAVNTYHSWALEPKVVQSRLTRYQFCCFRVNL